MQREKDYKRIRQLIDQSGLIKGSYRELIIGSIASYLVDHNATIREARNEKEETEM
jgi:hypothetical protein